MSPRTGMLLLAVTGIAVAFGFVYLMNVADTVDPQRSEKRIELPDAFKS